MPGKPKNENLQLPCGPNENTNPSSSPTNLPISALYAEFAQRDVPEQLKMELDLPPDVVTYGQALAKVLFNAAIKGNVAAAREIRESIEGKANQRRNAVGGERVEVLVTWEKSPLLNT